MSPGREVPHQPILQGRRLGMGRVLLVACGCPSKSPLTWWLKTTQICSLTVLEVRSPESVTLGRTGSFWRLQGRARVLAFPDSGGCLHSSACGPFLTSCCLLLLLSPLLLFVTSPASVFYNTCDDLEPITSALPLPSQDPCLNHTCRVPVAI